jgi:DNA-binding NtrC family response regulator
MEILVPPLRKRMEDIDLLVEHFLRAIILSEGRQKHFSKSAYEILLRYSFPGNIRELKNIVEGAYYSTSGEIIDVQHIPLHIRYGETNADKEIYFAEKIFAKIKNGSFNFNGEIKEPFLKRKISVPEVRQILHRLLVETCGRYKDAFRLMEIPEKEYAGVMQFLKRNACYLDFRSFRKRR